MAAKLLVPPATIPDGFDGDWDRDVGGHCPKRPASAHITPTAANCVRLGRGRGVRRVHEVGRCCYVQLGREMKARAEWCKGQSEPDF